MLKAYAVGFLSAVLAVAVVAGIWLTLQPPEEAGLRWGGEVYTSKQEFNGYLRSKGLSYRTWLARNPGAAPWEPATVRTPSAAGAPATGTSEAWWARTRPVAVGFLLVAGWALLLVLVSRRRTHSRRLRELVAERSRRRADSRRLRELVEERNIGAGDVAFGVLAVMAVAVFGMFVVVLVSA